MIKKILTLIIFLPLFCNAYHWNPVTPDSVHALNICFDAGYPFVVATTKGLLMNDGPSYSWVSYNYGLPVWEVIADPDSSGVLILVMGNGSYSDGIYKFYVNTHTFRVLEWIINPTFIKFNKLDHRFYAGTRFHGMKVSEDGIHWSDVPYFSGKAAAAMDIFDSHITVVQENNLFATYISSDTGNTWQQSTSSVPIHDLAYNHFGKLYGVYTGMSNSSGLYSSSDFGQTWDLEQYDMGMNTVGFDVIQNVFTGWHQPAGQTLGVAVYDSNSHEFSFMNSGLPCRNINKFKVNPIMSSIAIFACTDSGVYFTNDYMSELGAEGIENGNDVKISPNPARELIKFSFTETQEGEILLFDSGGRKLGGVRFTNGEAIIKCSDFRPGIFLYRVKNKEGFVVSSGKFVFL